MAKLKLRVPTLEALPKEQQAFYRAMDGGGFILDHEDDPDGFGIGNIRLLNAKLGEKDTDIGRLNKRIQGFAKPDGSLWTGDELAALTGSNAELARTLETLKDKSKTDEQKVAELVANAKKPLEAKLAQAEQSITRYRAATHTAFKQSIVQKGLDAANPQTRWRPFIKGDLERRIEVRESDDGTLTYVMLDDNGAIRYSSLSGKTGSAEIDEYVKGSEFRTAFGDLLTGDGKKGADINSPVDGGGNRSDQRPSGSDIVLPAGHTQKQFEDAFKQAKEKGGQVVFAEEGQRN